MKPMNHEDFVDFLVNIINLANLDKKANVESDDVDVDLPFTDVCYADASDACDRCPHFDKCMEDEMYEDPDFEVDDEYCTDIEPPMWGIPDIRRVVFSGPATIVFWEDNTKTVVKCMAGEKFEYYAGFAAACMKKMFGSTSRAKAIMNDLTEIQILDDDEANKPEPACTLSPHDEAIQEAINETFNG